MTIRLLLPAACLLLTAGCGQPVRGPQGFEVAVTSTGSEAVAAETIYPLEAGVWRYRLGDSGEPVEVRREPTDEFDADWADHQGDMRTEYWATDGHGAIALTAVADYEENALSLFRPPLAVAFPELHPGEQREAEAEMVVLDLDDRRKRKASGSATRTIEYVGNATVRVPAGEFEAHHLEIVFEADLSMADVTTTTTLYVVPGLGPVIIDEQQKVRTLGVFPDTTRHTLVLVEGP